MWTGILAALNLTDGADRDLWSVNTEASTSSSRATWTPSSRESTLFG